MRYDMLTSCEPSASRSSANVALHHHHAQQQIRVDQPVEDNNSSVQGVIGPSQSRVVDLTQPPSSVLKYKVFGIREIRGDVVVLCHEHDLPEAVKTSIMEEYDNDVNKRGDYATKLAMTSDTKCVPTASSKSACIWSKTRPGLYACRRCTSGADRACWRWSPRLNAFVVLPLVNDDGYIAKKEEKSRRMMNEYFGESEEDVFASVTFQQP